MGIFGIAKKGFGMLGKARAKKKMLQGTSTRAERLKHGERAPDIKRIKPAIKIPGSSAADVERSRQRGHTEAWVKRKKIADNLNKKVEEGKKAIKKRAHLGLTKVLKKQYGKYGADPTTGAKGTPPWSSPVKKTKTKTKTKHYYPPKDF